MPEVLYLDPSLRILIRTDRLLHYLRVIVGRQQIVGFQACVQVEVFHDDFERVLVDLLFDQREPAFAHIVDDFLFVIDDLLRVPVQVLQPLLLKVHLSSLIARPTGRDLEHFALPQQLFECLVLSDLLGTHLLHTLQEWVGFQPQQYGDGFGVVVLGRHVNGRATQLIFSIEVRPVLMQHSHQLTVVAFSAPVQCCLLGLYTVIDLCWVGLRNRQLGLESGPVRADPWLP